LFLLLLFVLALLKREVKRRRERAIGAVVIEDRIAGF
jgi:hypothetical protein